MRVAFITFGCRLSHAEALDQEARYAAAGHDVVKLNSSAKGDLTEAGSPDVIVIRGCSVTAKAQRDCEKTICRLRERFGEAKIIITGCLPGATSADLRDEPMKPAVNLTTSRAYLKVQDGCSGKCAFCIVPRFRGPPRSVPFGDVLAQAREFLAAGFRELVVTGCNLALYRDSGRDLSDLIAALARLQTADGTSSHRIRLGSLEPNINIDKFLGVLTDNPNVCRFIHLSVQSGADRILKLMNRPYSAAHVQKFRAEARRRLGPRLSLGADFITGFPGETEDDYAETHELAAGSDTLPPFVNLHVFPYSERPDTPASTMPGSVPRDVRLAHARNLEALGHDLRRRFAAGFLGQTVQVCVEKDGNGWTGEYLLAKLPPGFSRRQLIEARVAAVEGDTLLCT